MVTRIRIEAEGSTPAEVEQILQLAHGALTQGTPDYIMNQVFGEDDALGCQALVDAQCGEMVIERFAKDLNEEPGHGAIFWRGRMTSHYARRTPELDLRQPQTTAYAQ